AAGSAYALYFSYISVTNLQKYEKKTEKAAEWSSTAEEQLHKTRTTQGSAVLTIITSLISSSLLLYANSRGTWSSRVLFLLNAGNVANTLFTRAHVSNFWHNKAKVPFVEGYNDAISSTDIILKALTGLAAAWTVSTV
ncbi:uncharacterized protein K452DRAFT_195237, partial [Aplosporella prunicola CBS 121167]